MVLCKRTSKCFSIKIPSKRDSIPIVALALLLNFCDLAASASVEQQPLVPDLAQHPLFEKDKLPRLVESCPQIVPKIFENRVPRGKLGLNTTTYARQALQEPERAFQECYEGCCGDLECNMVFMFLNNSRISCYRVSFDQSFYGHRPRRESIDISKTVAKLVNLSYVVLVGL